MPGRVRVGYRSLERMGTPNFHPCKRYLILRGIAGLLTLLNPRENTLAWSELVSKIDISDKFLDSGLRLHRQPRTDPC